nr:hypothetical protein [Vulcanisaeta sp. JCM 16159]
MLYSDGSPRTTNAALPYLRNPSHITLALAIKVSALGSLTIGNPKKTIWASGLTYLLTIVYAKLLLLPVEWGMKTSLT